LNNSTSLGGGVEGISTEELPVIEHALRESLTRGVRTKISGKTERLVDRQVSLDHVDGGAGPLVLSEDMTTTPVEHTVDTTTSHIRALNLDKVNGLLESGLGSQLTSVEDTASSGDNLTATTVNSISVKGNIKNVETDSTHVLVTEDTLLGGPLESSDHGVLDLVQILHSLGGVNQKVGTGGVGTESPDLTGLVDVPVIGISQVTGTGLEVVTGGDLSILNLDGEIIIKRLSLAEETVVLVGRLGQTGTVGLGSDGLTVGNNGVSLAERNLGVLLLQILQTDLQVELTSTSNNVLTRLSNGTDNTRIRLGETLQTLDKLGEVTSGFGLDSNTHDRGDRELHDTDNRGLLVVGDGSTLEEVLINTDQTDSVTTGAIVDRLGVATHHEDGSLDRLEEEIGLGSLLVVGTENTDLLSSLNTSREHTSESVEATLVVGGHHLGDVHHEGTVRVTVLDTDSGLIVHVTSVQVLNTVLLGFHGGRQVHNDHFKKSITSRQELPHDSLKEGLSNHPLLLSGELDTELVDHLLVLGGLISHNLVEQLLDGLEDKLAPSTGDLSTVLVLLGFDPLLALDIKVVLTPELFHELLLLDTKLLGVHVGPPGEGESPTVETRTESDGTVSGVDEDITEELITVSGDDDVDVLNNLVEGLVTVLRLVLQFQENTVHLVDHKNGLDTLTESLTQHGLGLDTHTLNTIDDDQGTISDTESSRHLRREIDVAWGIDQVDQETLTSILGLLSTFLILGELVVQGHTSGLDSDATVLFILTGVSETGLTSLVISNDTGLGDERIGEGGLTVIDMSNDTHVPDVVPLLHLLLNLLDSETHHFARVCSKTKR